MRNRKGFTLMEVVVGMAIVAIVSIPLLQMFVTSTKVGRHSYDTDKANAVALQTVEQIKSGNYAFTLGGTDKSYYTYDWAPSTNTGSPFRMEVTVTGAISNAMQSTYTPQLVDATGNQYVISIDLGAMPTGSYTLGLTDEGGAYKLSCEPAALNFKGSGMVPLMNERYVTVPKEYLTSPLILPVAIDNSQNSTHYVTLAVTSSAAPQLGLYVFGDDDETKLVSMTTGSVNASITRLSAGIDSMTYDRLAIEAKVLRTADNSVIADYETLGYNVATASGVNVG